MKVVVEDIFGCVICVFNWSICLDDCDLCEVYVIWGSDYPVADGLPAYKSCHRLFGHEMVICPVCFQRSSLTPRMSSWYRSHSCNSCTSFPHWKKVLTFHAPILVCVFALMTASCIGQWMSDRLCSTTVMGGERLCR